ncbi:RAMP superfamily CRISPR-associated protein [Streptomyces sp. 4N509B]|uniref:RAMP superfamily CRISPR-associated protein n=1 Tax=Streptomyces sp. 4N509B TaxID=3457413 RepID=UPI003FCFD77F
MTPQHPTDPATAPATGRLGLRLHMVSDWHVGTGGGDHGHVDRLVQRDQDGLPHVPAKTLVGVWRDACELAANALDAGPTGAWHAWVADLFGTQEQLRRSPRPAAPRPARLAVDGALRVPGRVGAVLRDRPLLRQAVTFRKPGVAIDPRTGAAAEDLFRVEEMARAGTELVGTAELRDVDDLDERQRRAAVALLWCGARLVESIGGRRRRGAGRCRLELAGGDDLPEPDLAVLETTPPNPPPHRGTHVAATAAPEAGPGWEQATLVLRTRTPVLAYAQTQGNLVRGRDHLPGWVLLPNVLGRLRGRAAALAIRGDLVVTAATPGRPVPRVFTTAKDDPAAVRANTLAEAPPDGTKAARRGYLDDTAADEALRLRLPEMVVRMHNTIEDDVQRPTRDIGGVFIYSALAPRQEFRAQVRVRTGVLPAGWARSLAGTWRVGRSQKDDYGLVEVTVADTGPVPVDAASGGEPGETVPEGGRLRLWLQSELLVRDARLRPSTNGHDVARALERALASAGADGVRLEPVGNGEAAVGVGRVDSWHRGWGLPRPTLMGLAAGSCLTFRVARGTVPVAALREVETAGVGERTAEGFGQVLVNDALLSEPLAHRSLADGSPSDGTGDGSPSDGTHDRPGDGPQPEPAATAPTLAPAEPGHDEARVVERAAWRHAIHGAAESIAADRDQRSRIIPDGPTPTQLNAVRRLLPELDDEHVTDWLKRLRWPEADIGRLAPLLTEPDEVWARLRLPEEALTATRDGRTALREELRGEAVRALLTACLVAHAREAALQRPTDPAPERDLDPSRNRNGNGDRSHNRGNGRGRGRNRHRNPNGHRNGNQNGNRNGNRPGNGKEQRS